MSRYILIRRLRGPAFLLLVGVIALLAQAHILGWDQSWPLFLILAGVLLLAERAALAAEGYPLFPGAPYPPTSQGAPYPGAPNPAAGQGAQPSAGTDGTAIIPSHPHDFEKDMNGGQS
ncbi:MAG: hypothetical protein WB341_18855 [Terracidiphilus sp.]